MKKCLKDLPIKVHEKSELNTSLEVCNIQLVYLKYLCMSAITESIKSWLQSYEYSIIRLITKIWIQGMS